MKVLIVDDQDGLRRFLSRVVTGEGHDVIEAPNAEIAWNLIHEHQPDLVLTDYKMPAASGFDLLDRIRQEHRHMIVALLTAHGSEELAARALRIGANDYLRKPVQVIELRRMLKRYQGLVQERYLEEDVRSSIRRMQFTLQCDNRIELVPKISQFLVEQCDKRIDGDARFGLRLGLHEMIMNAVEHGNLGVTFEEKTAALNVGFTELQTLYAERLSNPIFAARRVTIDFFLEPEYLEWLISDEGSGFDWTRLQDPLAESNIHISHGRGVYLSRFQFDEMEYLNSGNRVRLRKYTRNDLADQQTDLFDHEDLDP